MALFSKGITCDIYFFLFISIIIFTFLKVYLYSPQNGLHLGHLVANFETFLLLISVRLQCAQRLLPPMFQLKRLTPLFLAMSFKYIYFYCSTLKVDS